MSFEDLQSAWQSADHGIPLQVPTELLLKEVRRNQQYFDGILFRRDAIEIAVATLLAGYFGRIAYMGRDWVFVVATGTCLFVGVFMFIDRRVQRKKRPKSDGSLQSCVQSSLDQVNHQIWLLRNIFWWYLLPIFIGWSAVVGSRVWRHIPNGSQQYFICESIYVVVAITLFYGGYLLNQYAVKKTLIPRREELETLLASLSSGKETIVTADASPR